MLLFLKIIGYILIFCLTIIGAYCVVRVAIRDQIKTTIQTTMREEFYLQELKGNVYYNDQTDAIR